MTQAKQKDKIQEIMGLADAYAHHERMQDAWAAEQCRALIESKLRELVREPLSEKELMDMNCVSIDFNDRNNALVVDRKTLLKYARAIERAHNITSANGEV